MGPTVLGPDGFELRPMPGVVIREPAVGRGRVPRGARGPRPPVQPPPPTPPPPKTPPPPPNTQEMEVDQRTPDPKEGVPEKASNKESVAKLSGDKAIVEGVAEEVVAAENAADGGFAAIIQQEVDTLINQPIEDAEAVHADGDQTGEGEEPTDPYKAEEAPSSSFPSFKTFQSGYMGFSTPQIPIPNSAWAEIRGRYGESVEAYFGGCSHLS
ncbi:zinc finger homeobox protein 4-like [Chenopodium quinoa]|uniref:zinc finger homeobox protein 4-like n=1 Tax=Chenopodium quinoa TaxID=63459 RepID=UPI000B789121|nr:zinc finger homeobox protein 4-like [Chenopodium quinoa]